MNNDNFMADARRRVNILHGKIFGMLLIYNLAIALGVAGFAAGLAVVFAGGCFFAACTDELPNSARTAEAVTNSRRFKRFSGRRWIRPGR